MTDALPMRRIVAGAFIGGLALRTLVAGFNGVISHDAACYYLPGARALLEHGLGHWEGMTIAAPPLFPTLVAILGRAIADLEIAALSIAVLAGAAIVFPVLGLGRLLCPGADRAHAFSVLLAAVQPLSLRFGGDARADSLYALLFACALWAGLRVLWRPSARGGALFGLLVGLGYLLRPEALGLLPLLAVAASAELWRRRREAGPTLRRIAGAALATLLLLAPALAWNVLFVHDRVGVWTLSPKAGMLLDYGKGGADPFTRLNRSRTMTLHEEKLSSPGAYRSFSPLGAIREGRGRMARAMLQNLWDYARYFPYALGGCPLVLFIVGIVAARRRFRPGSLWMTCGVFAFYGLSFSLFYVSRRFWLPLMPLALPWCGAGGVAIAGACAALWGVRGRSTACALLLLTLAQSARPLGLKEGGWWTGPERRLGARLAERHGEGVVYSSAKGRVAWYARGRHLTLPNAPLADIAYFMERRGCRLLVVDRARLEKKRAMLWRELQRSARFREVDAEAGTGRDLRVYRLE